MRMHTILTLAKLCLTALKFIFHSSFQQTNFRKKKLYSTNLGNRHGEVGHRPIRNMAHKYVLPIRMYGCVCVCVVRTVKI